MRTRRVRGTSGASLAPLAALLAAAALATPAPAQEGFAISVTFGTLGFPELQDQPTVVQRFDEEGAPEGEPVRLSRALEAQGGWHAGASVLYGFSSSWAVRAGAARGAATLSARHSGSVEDVVLEVRGLDAGTLGVTVTLWEAALRFRLPVEHALRPYAELGLGGLAVAADGDPTGLAGAAELDGGVRRTGIIAALGADLPLLPWLGARLQVTTGVSATPLSPVAAGAILIETEAIEATFDAPDAGSYGSGAVATIRTLRLEAGLSVRPGRAAARR